MTTVTQDFGTMLNTQVETAWPGANSVVDYFVSATMTLVPVTSLPNPPDFYLYAVIKTILETRTLDAYTKVDMTTPDRQDLYDDVIGRLTIERDRITATIAAITAARP